MEDTMPKPNRATAGQTAAANPKSPTGGHHRPPSDSRGTVEAGNADTAPAIIVFGPNASGKPTAAMFPADQVDLASKAAGLMQLRVLKIDSPELTQFAAQLPVGKIYASGHGFVPQVRTAIYDRLLQFADPARHRRRSPGDCPGRAGRRLVGSHRYRERRRHADPEMARLSKTSACRTAPRGARPVKADSGLAGTGMARAYSTARAPPQS